MNWLIGILIVGWMLLFVPMALLPLFSTDDVEQPAPAIAPDTAPPTPPTRLRQAPHAPRPAARTESSPVTTRRAA